MSRRRQTQGCGQTAGTGVIVAAIDRPSADRGGPDPPDPSLAVRNEILGDVLGPAVQARDIHGGIHVHHADPVLPSPRQLPPPVELCGRSADLAVIDAAAGNRTVVISGPPGIGKTALVVAWGTERCGGYPDGQLYADLRGHAGDGPVMPGEILGRFLRALGVQRQSLPAELAELTALYRSLTSGRRLLVVLDDAISAAQVRPLLPASAQSVTLVTSRWRLAGLVAGGARSVQLDRLETADAVDLLRQLLGADRVAAELAAAAELASLCAYFPLALCLCAARLAVRPRWRISELVHALRRERRRLAEVAVDDELAMRAALDLSYVPLGSQAARMYRLMGLFPGVSFGVSIAAAAADVPVDAARQLLGVLADANLLDDAAGGRYRFHDLIRLHALGLAEEKDTGAHADSARRRMLDWYLVAAIDAGQLIIPYRHDQPRDVRYRPDEPVTFGGQDEALEWLEQELPNLTAAIRFAAGHGHPQVAWQLVDALWPLFLRRGLYRERLELDRLGLAAARESGAKEGEAKLLGRLALALQQVGKLDEAAERTFQALSIWRETGNNRRMAGSLKRLGLIELARGRADGALEVFRQALEAYDRLGESRSAALILIDIGAALTGDGRAGEAIDHLARARDLLAGVPDPYNEARALAAIGRAQGILGERSEAAATLDLALRSMRDLGSLPGEADVLRLLGDLAESGGQATLARQRYAAALAIADRIGSPAAAQLKDLLAGPDRSHGQ